MTVAEQFADGIGQAMDSTAATATYNCAASGFSCTLPVVLTKPGYQIEEASGAMIASENWDIYLVASALLINGSTHVPQLGDTVVVTGTQGGTYTVLIPDGSRYCWTWADRFQVRRKLSAKLTA